MLCGIRKIDFQCWNHVHGTVTLTLHQVSLVVRFDKTRIVRQAAALWLRSASTTGTWPWHKLTQAAKLPSNIAMGWLLVAPPDLHIQTIMFFPCHKKHQRIITRQFWQDYPTEITIFEILLCTYNFNDVFQLCCFVVPPLWPPPVKKSQEAPALWEAVCKVSSMGAFTASSSTAWSGPGRNHVTGKGWRHVCLALSTAFFQNNK